MPKNEDVLGLEVLLSLDDVLDVVLTVVLDFGPHVVNHEWLRKVKLVVGVGHGLEVDGHGGTRLNVANLVHARGAVSVGVEELGQVGLVLWEQGVVVA